MFASVKTITFIGLSAFLTDVEVFLGSGLPKFDIVGLAAKAVQESKERVAAAIKKSGYKFHSGRITVNLAPTDLPKSGTSYDLPIAVAILAASGQIKLKEKAIFWGSLSLSGETAKTRGAIAVAEAVLENGELPLFLPEIIAEEAGIIEGITIKSVKSLARLGEHFAGKEIPDLKFVRGKRVPGNASEYDFADIKGQYQARRAAEIAAAGGHNILLSGTPGSGKTFLARCIAGILPGMQFREQLEVTKIYSLMGLLNTASLISERPFRNPHHTCSQIALIGGGSNPRPGEVTLAHNGVLFLDEFSEFTTLSLETLRQPLEDRLVNIARAGQIVTFPAKFMLVAATNPCKCGYRGDPERACKCSQLEIMRYERKLSGPVLDRIELQINMHRVKQEQLSGAPAGETSAQIRDRVEEARTRQRQRADKFGFKESVNAELNSKQILASAALTQKAKQLLAQAGETLQISARSYFKLIKVSRTIADFEQKEAVTEEHVAEAVSMRLSEAKIETVTEYQDKFRTSQGTH